jgi:hypothetical protein
MRACILSLVTLLILSLGCTEEQIVVQEKLIRRDSIIYVHDTLATSNNFYYDTLYCFFTEKQRYSVSSELQPMVNAFYEEAQARGWKFGGGLFMVEPWTQAENPDPGWSSYLLDYAGQQIIIKVVDNITLDEMMTPLWREMARWQLNKSYSREDVIMNPYFPTDKIRWSDRTKHKEQIDKLFEQ